MAESFFEIFTRFVLFKLITFLLRMFNEVNLNIMGYDYLQRRNDIETWYKESDPDKAKDFLTKNKISYVYWVKPQRGNLSEDELGLNKIFENKEAVIYKVVK